MNLKMLNYNMYKAALHLSEAGKHLMYIDKERGMSLLKEADMILSVIVPEKEKVSEERLNEILGEILAFEPTEEKSK